LDKDITISDYEQRFNTLMYVDNPDYGNAEAENSAQYLTVYQVKNNNMRIPVKIQDVPQNVRNAFVYVEDERFYQHDGVDYKRTFSAFANILLHFYDTEQGGSTITQQLIKNITGDSSHQIQRKIREIFRAMNFEQRYSKDEILEGYINVIEFGGGCEGVQTAAIKYFGKNCWELSNAEAACLAAIPKSPTTMNPFANPEKNRTRMEYVLASMYKNGALSYEEYEKALAEKLIFTNSEEYKQLHPEANNEILNKQTVTPWYVDAALYEFAGKLMEEENLSQKEAFNKINTGGYKIYLNIDLALQKHLESKYATYDMWPTRLSKADPKHPEGVKVQSSFIVMDYTGAVLAEVGGIGEKTTTLGLNRPVQSKRDPGSCIKPLTSYGFGIYSNTVQWSSIIQDSKIKLHDGTMWPNNASGGVTNAFYPLNYCLRKSYNTASAQIVSRLSLDKTYDFATTNMGLKLDPDDVTYSGLATGGLKYGITLENLVNGFVPYGNGGTYYDAHIISKVLNSDDEIVYDNTASDGYSAVDSETAYVMNNLLRGVIKGSGGTGTAANLGNGIIQAGKTGSSADYRDRNFVCLTENFVSGIWIGYDIQEKNSTRNFNPAEYWKKVIGDWVKAHPATRHFPESPSVRTAHYCTLSGNIAAAGCPSSADTGYYKSTNAPVCNGAHGSYQVEEELPPDDNVDYEVVVEDNTPQEADGQGVTPAPDIIPPDIENPLDGGLGQ
jgi:penicillin-binding protein 1A